MPINAWCRHRTEPHLQLELQGQISEQVKLREGLFIPEDAALVSGDVALGEDLALLPREGPLREGALARP